MRFENALLKDSGRSSWFAVSLAPNLADAEKLAAKFKALPQVSNVETIATYIPDAQAEKRAILASIKPEIAPIAIRPSHPDDAMLARELDSLRFKLASAKDSDPRAKLPKPPRGSDLHRQSCAITPLPSTTTIARWPPTLPPSSTPCAARSHPRRSRRRICLAILRDRFIGHNGAYLVQVYPRGDVWDDAPLASFVSALRSVDPDVTGPPVQTYSIATVMRQATSARRYWGCWRCSFSYSPIFVTCATRRWRRCRCCSGAHGCWRRWGCSDGSSTSQICSPSPSL